MGQNAACPVLVWIDLATGKLKARSPLWTLRSKQPMLGPLVSDGKRLWCFAEVADGNGALQPQRNIVEAMAAGPAIPPTVTADLWTAGVDPGLRGAAALSLPGWTLLSGEVDDKTGIRAEWNGGQNVLATRMADRPLRLARWVNVPPGTKLALEFGYNPSSAPQLEVRAAGKKLWEFVPKPESTADQWKSFEVDLSALAGRPVLLAIVQTRPTTGGSPSYAVWKRAELRGAGVEAD